MASHRLIASIALAAVVVTGFAVGCSSTTTTSSTPDAGADCATGNDKQCPATYSTVLGNQPCSPIGLSCTYYGGGSGAAPPGCGGAATLFCHDGGAESGVWGFSQ